MQNWNAGKTQEFKERREYVVANSLLKHVGPVPLECKMEDKPQQDEPKADAMGFMDKLGFAYRKILATEEPELAKSYGVRQAPTLVLPDGTKFAGAGAIKAYVSKTA